MPGSHTLHSRRLHPLLGLCARVEAPPGFHDRLAQALRAVDDWDLLVEMAQYHGLAPLLYHHLQGLTVAVPRAAELALKGLWAQTGRRNTLRFDSLRAILEAYQAAGIDTLVLKGAALAHLIYPDIHLRPMADLDVLVAPEQATRAVDILRAHGFRLSSHHPPTAAIAAARANAKSLDAVRFDARVTVQIELHFALFEAGRERRRPPPDFAALWRAAQGFDFAGVPAHTLGPEHMLWHVYRHGFFQSLRHTQHYTRLQHVADLVGVAEKWAGELDWENIQRRWPELISALALIHPLTPFSDAVLARLPALIAAPPPKDVGRLYQGYPSLYWSEHAARGLWASLRDTFAPPAWWLRLYYGLPAAGERDWAGYLRHGAWVLADVPVYLYRLLRGLEQPDPQPQTERLF